MSTQSILLRPRPLNHYSGTLLLLPLLPYRKLSKPLPSELWTEIFSFALFSEGKSSTLARNLLVVCSAFKVRLVRPDPHAKLTRIYIGYCITTDVRSCIYLAGIQGWLCFIHCLTGGLTSFIVGTILRTAKFCR